MGVRVTELAEWDWLISPRGEVLHHARVWLVGDDETVGLGDTSCGRRGMVLSIPGIFTRMGAPRCSRCCTAMGYPQGVGSPKNDERCRPLVEVILSGGIGR